MRSAHQQRSDIAALRIEGEMTIYRSAELKQVLLAPLSSPIVLEVDLSGVTEIDTAGLQLLILAKITAPARQCELHLVAHSPAILEVFELLNLTAYFGDPLVIPPLATGTAERASSNSSARHSHES